MKKRWIAAAAAAVLLLGCVAGGSLAWLIDRTEAKVNTFTVGNIEMALEETTTDYKMVPGCTIDKDPTVSVTAESEACWLFVKVEETNWSRFPDANGTAKVFYSVDVQKGWIALNDHPGVYYREVSAEDAQRGDAYDVNCNVTVSQMLTKAEVNSIAAGIQPRLSFTAYAVQRLGIDDAAAAWAAANNP